MTRQGIEKELQSSLSVLKSTGMIEREAMDFIAKAVEEKLARQEEDLAVKRKEYLDAVADRAKRMSDENLGRFVKNTLWTASDTYKKGDGY